MTRSHPLTVGFVGTDSLPEGLQMSDRSITRQRFPIRHRGLRHLGDSSRLTREAAFVINGIAYDVWGRPVVVSGVERGPGRLRALTHVCEPCEAYKNCVCMGNEPPHERSTQQIDDDSQPTI